MVSLSILLKPLGVLLFYAVARWIAYRIKRFIPPKWQEGLYKPFTQVSQEAQQRHHARRQAPGAQAVDQG